VGTFLTMHPGTIVLCDVGTHSMMALVDSPHAFMFGVHIICHSSAYKLMFIVSMATPRHPDSPRSPWKTGRLRCHLGDKACPDFQGHLIAFVTMLMLTA
jgi:hypothetical protein